MAARTQSVIVRLLVLSYLINVGSLAQTFSNFTCDNATTEINFFDVCDGEVNCADRTDETGCDNNPILFYYIYHRSIPADDVLSACERCSEGDLSTCEKCSTDNYGFVKLNVTGAYLNDQKEFSIVLQNETVQRGMGIHDRTSWERELPEKLTDIRIRPDGHQFYIVYKFYSYSWYVVKQVTRAGYAETPESDITGETNIRNMVFDLTTTNVYFISGSKIKVCDHNVITCSDLSSKFINQPVSLTISSEHRLLFWIEKISERKFHLYKYYTDLSSKPKVLRQDVQTPVWLTVDVIQERVYWVDSHDDSNNVSAIHSIKFGGTNYQTIILGSSSEPVSSLAVFNNTIYWSCKNLPQIWRCSVGNCTEPTLFRQFDGAPTIQVGSLMLDHRFSPTKSIQNACTNSSCSHLCLLRQNTSFSCYCEGLDQPLPASKNNGYCEDTTMIVAYQNYLYTVGFSRGRRPTPIINERRININSISSVAYDSIKGNVILTETEQQKIYSWVPRTGDLILLSDDGLGSIKSIEFDNYANNLYWIDPVRRVIRVMNLDSRLKLTILEGNSTYVPFQLTLAPTKGLIFVQFLKNSSTVIIERIPMDGRRVGTTIYVDEEIEDETSLHLYYRRETDETLCLLDRQTNKIRYHNENLGFWDAAYSRSVRKMNSLTSLNNAIFWLEDDMIYQGRIEAPRIQIEIDRKIPLDFSKTGNGTLKMAPVESVIQPSSAPCLQNNGGCQELCLVSDETTKFACACTGNKILVDGTLCRNVSDVSVIIPTTGANPTAEPSTSSSKSGLETERSSMMPVVVQTEEAESICMKSCPPIPNCSSCVQTTTTAEALSTRIIQIEIRKNGTNSTETSCPVCEDSTSPLTSAQSSSNHVLNWIFNSILAILLGFALGYVIQKYHSGAPHFYAIFHPRNGTLELSQRRAESTIPSSS